MDQSLTLPKSLSQVSLDNELPPLVIVAFTRPDLLIHVLNGVRQQTLRPQQIIAFIDGSRGPADEPLIAECISQLTQLAQEFPVKIVTRDQNLGCDKNVVLALTEVLSDYDSLVYLEDDTVPNPYFFDRMCRLLKAYRHCKKVFSISAYANFPKSLSSSIKDDFIVSNRVFSWGFGLWADRWQSIDLVNKSPQYNPFGHFYNIPTTVQTTLTLINQFWLEKNKQTDWVITTTLSALHQQKVHIIPTTSFVKNIGFGHVQSKTYRGKEAPWVNARYDALAKPDQLPATSELAQSLSQSLDGASLTHFLAKQKGMWLSPKAVWTFLTKVHDISGSLTLLALFMKRLPLLLKRWRSGLPV